MRLTKLAITRPIVILMLFLALVVLGWKSKSEMTVDLNPKVDAPWVVITTIYPGAGPEEIETLVSKPLEDSVGSVNGLKNMTSSSQEGISVLALEFELEVDNDVALSDVRAKVDTAKMFLPQDAENPVVQKMDFGAQPILQIGMSSKRPARELRDLADEMIKDRLSKISGVAAISITGGEQREIQVNVDRNRLEAYGLSINQVAAALAAGNLNLPGGRITEGGHDYAVRAVGEFESIDEIRSLKIHFPGGDNGRVLTIGDIAEIKDASAEREEVARLQQESSIGLLVQKQSDANTVDVSDEVKEELEKMKSVLPQDVEMAISFDQAERVNESIADVNVSLWLGVFLVVLIVFLFLHNIRGTFIVAIAIPTCIMATYIPIHFFGFTVNTLVMMAFSLAVGILVDDSIVVLENIYRHLSHGEDPAEAALNGRSEIGLAAVTITMVDVVVFLPIAFMGGMVGRFFREFGITIACATLFSLFVSFTLTPMLASRWYKRGEAVESPTGFFARFDAFYHALDGRYRNLLAWALRHRWVVIVTGLGAMVLTMMMVMPRLGFEFFPRQDGGRVNITVEMPVGSSLDATDAVVMQIEDMAAKIPEVENIFTTVGKSTSGDFGSEQGANIGDITLALHEKESVMDRLMRPLVKKHKRIRTDEMIAAEMRENVQSVAGGRIKITAGEEGFGGSPVDIELSGPDMNELNVVAAQVKAAVASTEGAVNTDVSWKVGKPEVKASIDRVRAAELGLSVGEIASALRTSVAGSTDTQFRDNGKEYDIRVRLAEFDRYAVSDVARIVVGSKDSMPIYLQDVAQISSDTGPTKIERKNRQRKVSVTANLAPGYALGNVQRVLNEKLAKVDLGTVNLNWGGEAEIMAESFKNMAITMLLSILLVYMLMAALFESLLNPLIIICSVPMALIGAALGLYVAGETMSIVAMIGIIMLIGLVTKNAILLVDYTNTLRSTGMERNEAILQAGPTRLRPILMTTLAMIGGMLPTALKLGRGGEFRAPMAIAVIGGLIVSTLLTLVMIPTLYTLVDDFVRWWHRLWNRGQDRPLDPPPPGGDGKKPEPQEIGPHEVMSGIGKEGVFRE